MNTRGTKAKQQNTPSSQASQPVAQVVSEKSTSANSEIAKELGKFCMDVAKLVIGGVILSGLMKQGIDYYVIGPLGGFVVLVLMLLGVGLIKYSNKYKK